MRCAALHFGSLGIMIGGLGTWRRIAPRDHSLDEIDVSGTLTTCLWCDVGV